jgi:protein-disulfide isomerase
MIRLALAALFCLGLAASAAGESPAVSAGPQSLGDPSAPVTIIEYASLSCPHCASFHEERLPWLKKTYIDTGRVRLEFRDFPLNAPALWAAMLAHCAGKDHYFAYLDLLFARQDRWVSGDQVQPRLKRIAQQAGMSGADFDACMADQPLQDQIIKSRADAIDEYGVNSTPTFVIDGEVINGVPSEADLTRRIEAAGG